jgi:hypothetical protein
MQVCTLLIVYLEEHYMVSIEVTTNLTDGSSLIRGYIEGRRPLYRMHRGPKHPFVVVTTVVTIAAAWILFVATTNQHEFLVGLVAASATIVFTLFVCHSSATNLRLRPRDVIQLCRIPWYVLSGAYEIMLVLVKDVLHLRAAESLYRVCGFDSSTHDPVRVSRNVLAVAYTTAAPNFIVIGVDPALSRMLFHQIETSPCGG